VDADSYRRGPASTDSGGWIKELAMAVMVNHKNIEVFIGFDVE
jgi:hypothetical protein